MDHEVSFGLHYIFPDVNLGAPGAVVVLGLPDKVHEVAATAVVDVGGLAVPPDWHFIVVAA